MSYSDRYYRNLYRQQNTPNLQTGSAGLTAATFNPIIYTPGKRDTNILVRSLEKLDERKEKTNQQRAAVTAAISKFPLNAAEDEWKQNYINDINKRIDEAAQFGDYSAALDEAYTLARDVAKDPELNLRVRANEQYNKWVSDVENLEKAGKIDTVTKDRLLAQNKYRFVGRRDANNNLISASNWEDVGGQYGGKVESPVQKVSLDALLIATNNYVAEQSGAGEKYTALTADGKQVEIYDPNSAILSKSGSGWASKSYADLQAVFNEMKIRHPEAIAYLTQQYKDADWQIKDLQRQEAEAKAKGDEGTAIALDGQIRALQDAIMPNGVRISLPEYLARQTETTLNKMSYNRTTSTASISAGAKITPNPNNPTNQSGLDMSNSHPGSDAGVAKVSEYVTQMDEKPAQVKSLITWLKEKSK